MEKGTMNERQLQKRIRTKKIILQAAKELIHENGFNRLSLRAVAARAGFSPASLYEYFTGKDDIIDMLCAQIDEAWSVKLHSHDSIQDLMLGYVEFGVNASDDFQLLYQRAMLPDQQEHIPKLFTERIEEHSGELLVSATVAVQTMWSLVHGMVLLSLHRDMDHANHTEIVHVVWQGLLKSSTQ